MTRATSSTPPRGVLVWACQGGVHEETRRSRGRSARPGCRLTAMGRVAPLLTRCLPRSGRAELPRLVVVLAVAGLLAVGCGYGKDSETNQMLDRVESYEAATLPSEASPSTTATPASPAGVADSVATAVRAQCEARGSGGRPAGDVATEVASSYRPELVQLVFLACLHGLGSAGAQERREQDVFHPPVTTRGSDVPIEEEIEVEGRRGP